MSYIPADDLQRKSLPIFRQIARYFPKTLREVTRVSVVGNAKHNPERDPADIHWTREKSRDQLGSAMRHILEYAVDGRVFDEVGKDVAERTGIQRIYILAQAVWRLSAACEEEIERQEDAQRVEANGVPEASATEASVCHCGAGFTGHRDSTGRLHGAEGCDTVPIYGRTK